MSTASITTGTTVRITGDTCDMLHDREPGTIGTVKEVDAKTALVWVENDPSGEGPNEWWVGYSDLQPVEATFTSTPAEVVAEPEDVTAALLAEQAGRMVEQARRISTLEHELDRANERVEQFRVRESEAVRGFTAFKGSVTARLKEAVGDGVLTKDEANSILDDLGCDPVTSEYRVTVEHEGQTVLVVVVEADDEDDACDKVRDDLGATIQRVEIEVEFEYNGDGEVEESDTYTDEDESGVDASDYLYNLSISAEEV